MKAVILAAGDGARLAPLTRQLPKCLLPIGGETVLERLLRQCKRSQISEVGIVIGYQGHLVREHIGPSFQGISITYLENSEFSRTSTAYSAYLTREWVCAEPFVLMDGDIVMEDSVLPHVLKAGKTGIVYEAKSISSPEEMKVSCPNDGTLHLSKEISADDSMGEFAGIFVFAKPESLKFFHILSGYSKARLEQSYYESAINDLTLDNTNAMFIEIGSTQWIEIDFVTDYLEAVRLFSDQRSHPQWETTAISEQILLCPGPVMVSKAVKTALMHADIGHRETEFIEILTRTRRKLLQVFGADQSGLYTDVILTGSGTAANESLLSTYGPGKRLLIVSNGEFGNRLIDIARCHQLDATVCEFGWMQPIELDSVRELLKSGRFDALMMVHHETSTGMLNPIYEVGAIAKQYQADFLVDAVSSIGAEDLNVEEANITFCTASANKAIASLPGLAFVCGKREAFAALNRKAARTRYLDLYKHYEFEELHYQTPNTPAVSLFYALETAVDEFLADGIEKRMNHCKQLSASIRNSLKELGVSFVIPEDQMSCVLTTVYYPDGIDAEAFHAYVKEHNFVIYRGKGPLLGRAFQIANIGHVKQEHIEEFLRVMKQGFDFAKTRMIAQSV
ncbi:aminotransferase class V-fold PLP-dependent enzyme [Fodinisporobacter ferrooxydans]|uniref:Aminotransferase class V-fold PLP-dependent enzyme n=1 Tax=Fodinisporobacter ferrooxydans TaxID=2901836 RepID=A0ABY4CIY1_9BACL|nr:aminotransferase class V-fold PLP-dependent enzyme [Alicyclobacillaceae bacterium MYW30-H2]